VDADDVRFMRAALAEAERGLAANEQPIGAVTMLDGEIVSATHWRYRPDGLLDHADVVALRAERDSGIHRRRRRDVTLFVTLEPCLMCMGAAMSFRVGRIVFALEAPFRRRERRRGRLAASARSPAARLQVYTIPRTSSEVLPRGAGVDAH
jgi:tRNA(Arg) A34 adenosine deaminase TadA